MFLHQLNLLRVLQGDFHKPLYLGSFAVQLTILMSGAGGI